MTSSVRERRPSSSATHPPLNVVQCVRTSWKRTACANGRTSGRPSPEGCACHPRRVRDPRHPRHDIWSSILPRDTHRRRVYERIVLICVCASAKTGPLTLPLAFPADSRATRQVARGRGKEVLVERARGWRVDVCHIARFTRLHNISGLPAGCYFSRRS